MKSFIHTHLHFLGSFTLGLSLALGQSSVQAQSAASTGPSAEPPPIVLGQPQDLPYVVIIPTDDSRVLAWLQRRIPEAFLSASRLGRYIQAAAFSEREPAEELSQQLRSHGLDARVVYLRI